MTVTIQDLLEADQNKEAALDSLMHMENLEIHEIMEDLSLTESESEVCKEYMCTLLSKRYKHTLELANEMEDLYARDKM